MTLPLTDALEELISLGVEGAALVAAMRRLEAVTYEQRIETLEEAVRAATEREDAALAERNARKAKDRDRKNPKPNGSTEIHGNPRNSEEVHGTSTETPAPLSPAPQTPQPHTPVPGNISTRARGPSCGKPNGFARFWEAYPNKVGKSAAEKSYARAIGKISGPDPPAVLLAGVERAKASREWREGYIPHPTTWLNQGRWEDEPAEIIPLEPRKAPHERPDPDAKFNARQTNHADAFEGARRAAGRDWKP